MARYPGATWRPVAGHTDGPMRAYFGAVLHVNESNGNLFNWVAGDHGMSCHFEVYKSGAVEQYLDTDVSSWCQMAGNSDYLSIETEGFATEPLTALQMGATGLLLRWMHQMHGFPLRLAEAPGQPGLGWHGMGGAAWGGHTGCPGPQRRAQRTQILALAAGSPAKPPPGDAMFRFKIYGVKGKPAAATAPGHWRNINRDTYLVMVAAGECEDKIHMLTPKQFDDLRIVFVGGNT